MAVYALGIWTVKPGLDDQFVEAWRHMAVQTAAELPAPSATRLRDRDQPNRFIGYGPWPSLDGFKPHTMDAAVMIGD